jgi:hypothetical protein
VAAQESTRDVKLLTEAPRSQPITKSKPFDFDFIKILLSDKSSKDNKAVVKEVMLSRTWLEKTRAIPHFNDVISKVENSEGIEITMNCNTQAFEWIIETTKLYH